MNRRATNLRDRVLSVASKLFGRIVHGIRVVTSLIFAGAHRFGPLGGRLRVLAVAQDFEITSSLVTSIREFRGSRKFRGVLARDLRTPGANATGTFRLRILKLVDGTVLHNSRFTSVILGRDVVIPSRTEEGPWALVPDRRFPRVAGFLLQWGKYVLFRRPGISIQVPKALYIGTRSPGNWYHWLANTLPALCIANLANVPRSVPLILPSELKTRPTFIEGLELFLGDRPILWLEPKSALSVSEITWIHSPVYDAPYSRSLERRLPHSFDLEALRYFREQVLNNCQGSGDNGKEDKSRLYFSRPEGASRNYNQSELEQVSKKYGFLIVHLEDLSFCDQVRLINGAKVVVGPSGAAFANILFAEPGLQAMVLSGPMREHEDFFKVLGQVSGVVVTYLSGQQVGEFRNRDFHFSPELLEHRLSTLDFH